MASIGLSWAVPDAYDVDVELDSWCCQVHPAHADALCAVQPREPGVGGRERRCDHDGQSGVEVAVPRPRVAVRSKVEEPAVRAVDTCALARLEAYLDVEDSDAVPADRRPVGCTRQDHR